MSLLSRNDRSILCAATGIDPLIIDRATDAFDSLIDRHDVGAYKRYMETAIVQQNFGRPVRAQDRPTAVDRVKVHLLRAYADREHISNAKAVERVKRMLEG